MSWLREELDPEVQRRRLVREKEERRALTMHRPLTTEQTYRWFGTFLGLFPPLALFGRFIMASGVYSDASLIVALCVGMNVVCCVAGRKFGAFLGRKFGNPRTRSRTSFAFTTLFMAIFWGVVTGGLGGLLCFGFGAIFGILFAVPIALAAFPAFAILHRLISRGGMIEARHTWPLAFGIPLTIAAMIMSPWLK
jgi:hypothetical protein